MFRTQHLLLLNADGLQFVSDSTSCGSLDGFQLAQPPSSCCLQADSSRRLVTAVWAEKLSNCESKTNYRLTFAVPVRETDLV